MHHPPVDGGQLSRRVERNDVTTNAAGNRLKYCPPSLRNDDLRVEE
jgi:hypothetical protein